MSDTKNLEVPTPEGYRAHRMVVTYVYDNKEPPLKNKEPIEVVPEKVTAKPKPPKIPITISEKSMKIPVDSNGKITVPLSRKRKVGGQCEMCWKESAPDHDLCHRCRAKIIHRFYLASHSQDRS
tara:strand:- start:744 stop:1115 length:372 start_codon:yes stop_codon:yes gene_type:complete